MVSRRRHSKLFSGFVIGVGSVFLAILALFIIFMLNNRPPKIVIPTPKMPKVNGWDDFVQASEEITATATTIASSPKIIHFRIANTPKATNICPI